MRRKELYYRERRPTRLAKAINRSWAFVYGLGILPNFLVALETRGRKTRRRRVNAVVIADHAGNRYLVSMLGEDVDWLRNARADGGRAVIKHGRRRQVILRDVPIEERGPVLKAYYQRATGARWHFPDPISENSVVEDFQKIAAAYPILRIEPPEKV